MTAIDHHAALLSAGHVGRIRLRDVAPPLRVSLYAALDAGLARFDGAVTHGATGVTTFFYVYA
jgi:hypothetical protein